MDTPKLVSFRLIKCAADGSPVELVSSLPEQITANCAATAELFRRIGYCDPWVGYVAADAGIAVGGGAFVGAPRDNHVEIAYYTLKEWERRGYAKRTAAGLVAIATAVKPGIVVRAFTLPEHNASTAVLQATGFVHVGNSHDPDAGPTWEWQLATSRP